MRAIKAMTYAGTCHRCGYDIRWLGPLACYCRVCEYQLRHEAENRRYVDAIAIVQTIKQGMQDAVDSFVLMWRGTLFPQYTRDELGNIQLQAVALGKDTIAIGPPTKVTSKRPRVNHNLNGYRKARGKKRRSK